MSLCIFPLKIKKSTISYPLWKYLFDYVVIICFHSNFRFESKIFIKSMIMNYGKIYNVVIRVVLQAHLETSAVSGVLITG